MFKGNSEKNAALTETTQLTNILGKGSVIRGDLETVGNFRVEGSVYGNIYSKAKVVLSDTAELKGHLVSQNGEIAGRIEGTIQVVELLVIKSTAKIFGDITCKKLIIEAGAQFNGRCDTGEHVKTDNINLDPIEKKIIAK